VSVGCELLVCDHNKEVSENCFVEKEKKGGVIERLMKRKD
jgi:hypothetical protein